MKIKTKLQLIIIVNILILVGIVSVSLLWQKKTNRQFKQEALVMELNQAIFERARLREEYFLYREDRSKEQFLLLHKQIGGLIDRMSGTFTGLEEKASLIKMMGFHNKIEGFFNQLVRLDQSAAVHTATTRELRERIISQMLVNADLLYREGLRLVNAANEKTVYQNNLAHLYSNIVFGLLALFIVTLAVIIIRSVTYPLTRLHKGTEIIAEGNLDYKTNIRTPDEIGQLSTAFDVMTENLKKITVSREELSEEIEERKRAEEALRESEKEAKRFSQENAIMAEIGRIIGSTLEIEEVYERFSAEVSKLIPFDRINIAIIHPEEATATIAYHTGIEVAGRQAGDVFPLAGSLVEVVVKTRSGVIVDMEGREELAERFPGLLSTFDAGFRYTMSVPLTSRGQVIGALFFCRMKPKGYTGESLRLAEKVGQQIAGAIANAQLFTARKQAEEEKHRLEERSRKVVEDIFRFIPEGVLVFSRKMELLRQNQAFRELVSGYAGRLGFAEDELENLIIDKIKAGMVDKNIKEIRISRKHETGKQT